MKKTLALILALALALALAACGATSSASPSDLDTPAPETTAPTAEPDPTDPPAPPEETEEAPVVMSYAEYEAAAIDDPVVIETYVQAHQSWWDNKVTVYAQSEDGAYFIYNMAASEDEANALVPGTKIRVTGYKAEWAGEVEIADATFELLSGSYIAPATDVTELLGTEELIAHQNEFVSFKGMTVEAKGENGEAFLYSWDGSGEEGSDRYFDVSLNGQTYTFTVESYLCPPGTDVYEAVKSLQAGDVIDMEGFLYWYEGVNPHITSVTPAA